MGRPPCCDKVGVKKGPWTPEEDIILVSYIQEHGPGNWRSVPTNTGLLRCSKSCRLRWTNYLRPGIKRGNFTSHEEGMIIHLQALLGNKWAAIATYLPQRTDNDIKNYWNTHLKKKLKKLQTAMETHMVSADSTTSQLVSKSYSETRSLDMTHQASVHRLNQTSTYASSTENISRLLEGWMRSPKSTPLRKTLEKEENQSSASSSSTSNKNKCSSNTVAINSFQCNQAKVEQESCGPNLNEGFESFLSFENLSGIAWEKSSSDSTLHGSHSTNPTDERKQRLENQQPPLSVIENWLLDEATGQVEEMMELSSFF